MKSGVTCWPNGSRIAIAMWFARHRELARWALEGDADEMTNAQRFFPCSAAISNSPLEHHE